MALEELTAQVARDGESLTDALERIGHSYPDVGRLDLQFGPHLDELLTLRLESKPWARLLLGHALYDIRRDRAAAEALLAKTDRAFRRRQDSSGQGHVAYVRGIIALSRGQIEDAAVHWKRSRELMAADAPLQATALSQLALEAYMTGELFGGLRMAEEAVAVAQLHEDRRSEAIAQLYIGFLAMNLGDFTRTETALDLAAAVFDEMPNPVDRYEYPLVHAVRGVLSALRGEYEASEASFAAAIDLAVELQIPWYAAMAKAARAEFLAHRDPKRGRADARSARIFLSDTGDTWWRTWAERGAALAAREAGNLATAERQLRDLLDAELCPPERGRTLVCLGEVYLSQGLLDEARRVLDEAVAILERVGARHQLVRALVSVAAASTGRRRGAVLRRAHALADEDAAFRALLAPDGRVTIRVLGDNAILVNGHQAKFKTRRAELLVYALALAAPRPLHADELIERLWPDAPDGGRPRLNTAFWEAREALGMEQCRLHREHDLLSIDLRGARFDYGAATMLVNNAMSALSESSEAAAEAMTALDAPLLPAWQYEEWVLDAEAARTALVERFRRLTAAER